MAGMCAGRPQFCNQTSCSTSPLPLSTWLQKKIDAFQFSRVFLTVLSSWINAAGLCNKLFN